MILFDHNQDYILENERVLLRPLQEKDFEHLLPFAMQEQDLWQYSLVQAIGADGLKNYIQAALQAKENKTEYPFIVFDKVKNTYAGSTRFYDIQLQNSSTQLGFTWYGKSFQGSGLNNHCKYLLLEFAFEKIGFERVEFRADNDNARSIAAMKKIGCVQEGILRSNGYRANGQRRDSIVLSILKHEWIQSKKLYLLKLMNNEL
jgi:RimJ/RimL family protein N-acetyltransferase